MFADSLVLVFNTYCVAEYYSFDFDLDIKSKIKQRNATVLLHLAWPQERTDSWICNAHVLYTSDITASQTRAEQYSKCLLFYIGLLK